MENTNNVLVIESDNDSSITYHKNTIKTEYDNMPDFDGIVEIFNNDPEMLYDVDTRKYLSIIDKSGKEYSISELLDRSDDIQFLKITNDVLKKHDAEIFIDYKFYRDSYAPWAQWGSVKNAKTYASKLPDYPKDISKYKIYHPDSQVKSLEIPENDYSLEREMTIIDGYQICQDIIESANKKQNRLKRFINALCKKSNSDALPVAVEYCNGHKIKLCDNVYKGYLPSLYQMDLICKCMPIIDFIMSGNLGIFFWGPDSTFWTVNEYNAIWAFTVCRNVNYHNIRLYYKSNSSYAFLIYKKV